ncbi:hypothetical protein [Moraxella oblonga]|uniref:hypothetical protein n=1 Tax=Moraxella oblonga TaxID=200413 RepID=UPI000833DFC6|nr:hypothetical protein [Moraxella oblonga]
MTWYIDIFGKEPTTWQNYDELKDWLLENQFYQNDVYEFSHKLIKLSVVLALTDNPNSYCVNDDNLPKKINFVSMICYDDGDVEKWYWQWAINFCQTFDWKIQDDQFN